MFVESAAGGNNAQAHGMVDSDWGGIYDTV
jgi:hypothetical protein